jgi:hypothetical protein
MSGATRHSFQANTTPRALTRAGWLAGLCAALTLVGLNIALAEEVVTTDPPSRVARISHMDGEVTFAPAGSDEWAEAILNRPVTSGDRLWTESGARAELQIGSAAAYLDEKTAFGFVELDDDVMQMSVTSGRATLRVRRLADGETIQVETPNVTIALREPGEYSIEVEPETDRTIVKTRHGSADVFANDERHRVAANQQGEFTGLEPLAAQIQPLSPRTAFENWANDRERRETESRSAQYVSRDVVGYEDLDEHGDWVHEPEYGYIWRPRYVTYDWVPYRDGRWVWISPWGWTWVDRSPWGFAPFHYGRWAHVRNHWHWVPGPRHYRPVYAPALVGWIGAPSVSVSVSFGSGIGWFPLAPREVYVPGYRYSPRYIRHINASNTIIVNHTYITNVYSAHQPRFDYRYRHQPRAITAVDRNHFVGGRPVMGRVMRVEERELRNWRDSVRPPALAPDRASVLAGGVRRSPPVAQLQRERIDARRPVNRVGFAAERRQIEANGGRPIGRTQLYTGNPKDQTRAGDARREFRGNVLRTEIRAPGAAPNAAPNNDRRRDANRSESPRVSTPSANPYARGANERASRPAERIESMPAREIRRDNVTRTEVNQLRGAQPRASRDPGSAPQAQQQRFTQPEINREPTPRSIPESRTNTPRTQSFQSDRPPPVRQQSTPPETRQQYSPPPQRESTPRNYAPSQQRQPSSSRSEGGGRSHSAPSRNYGSGTRER